MNSDSIYYLIEAKSHYVEKLDTFFFRKKSFENDSILEPYSFRKNQKELLESNFKTL